MASIMKSIPKINPRKIDQLSILDALRNEMQRKIDQEYRRRKGKVDTTPMEHVKRQLGRSDISDIPQDMPWQKIALEKYGITIPLNAPYVCPKCGQKYLRAIPPPRCTKCGFRTIIGRMLDDGVLRR